MKKIHLTALAMAMLGITACNNDNPKTGHEGHEKTQDSTTKSNSPAEKEVKSVAVSFTDVDPRVAGTIKEIVDHYLHTKNALASDNAAEAARGAGAIQEALGKLDKSLLTAEQKAAYDKNETTLKDQSENIAANGEKISQQRIHFVMLSEAVYDLVKHFGGGRPLYHDHCPMARDNQGALWLSETKEVKNPYFGAEMYTCGTVEELIQ